jgi:hypothetical protein
MACKAIIAKTRALAASSEKYPGRPRIAGNPSTPPRLLLTTKEENNVFQNRSRDTVINWYGDIRFCADGR